MRILQTHVKGQLSVLQEISNKTQSGERDNMLLNKLDTKDAAFRGRTESVCRRFILPPGTSSNPIKSLSIIRSRGLHLHFF